MLCNGMFFWFLHVGGVLLFFFFFIVMDWEMGNCFSTRKSKTTAFCVEWPFRLCAWTTNKKNTMKCSMGKHSELDSPLCCSSSAPNQFNWTKMELCYPYYLKRRGLILLFCRILPIIPEDSGLQRISTADSLWKENYCPWESFFNGYIGWMSRRIKKVQKILAQFSEIEDVYDMRCVLCIWHDVSWHDLTCFRKNVL